MPIPGIEQPKLLEVDEELRLRKYDDNDDFALAWYQDEETLIMVDGVYKPYDMQRLKKMYHYLRERGEVYFIELKNGDEYRPVGDITFWKDDMPIVVGEKNLRAKHIGRRAVSALVQRAKELGYPEIYVDEIYHYNIGSQKCFESVGFECYEQTEDGKRYRLKLAE